MDRTYINSILRVILESNMSERNIKELGLRPITCSIEKGEEVHKVEICLSEVMFNSRAKLSEAWIASNLLLFTIFDGYLEDKYGLIEGASFKNHYQHLPDVSDIEKIQKDCYRIMKLIRNAAQHNLSSIVHNDGGYDIEYTFNGTHYRLKISKDGLDCLYTIIVDIVQENIKGMYKEFNTKGHYEGIIRKLYKEMCSEIIDMNDDCGGGGRATMLGIELGYVERYPVRNPTIISESGKLLFKHIANKAFEDKNGIAHYYQTDYVYKEHVLPQEIGKIISNFENKGYNAIEFDMSCLCELWKVDM